jgi:hypothetical protein
MRSFFNLKNFSLNNSPLPVNFFFFDKENAVWVIKLHGLTSTNGFGGYHLSKWVVEPNQLIGGKGETAGCRGKITVRWMVNGG